MKEAKCPPNWYPTRIGHMNDVKNGACKDNDYINCQYHDADYSGMYYHNGYWTACESCAKNPNYLGVIDKIKICIQKYHS